MCGILVCKGLGKPFHHRLLDSLRKRGPDQTGFWADDHVQIGHSRLAIIGLDERSSEPLESRRFVMAFNGEIYNFLEIKRKLESEGLNLTGANDATVLLHAWEQWGPSILKDLIGFWAFVLYDKIEKKLLLVRDQVGVKPLYYWHAGDQVCVSSMIRTILDVLQTSPDLDFLALSEYVRYQFTFGNKTFFKGIKKVLPGQIVEIALKTGECRAETYEDIFASTGDHAQTITAPWIEETRDLIRKCVIDSTISDTSFTTFCSGGIDSSLITRLAEPEVAYHCNYSDPDCNETFYAKQVVEGTATRLFVVNAQEDFDLVGKLRGIVEDFDELTIGSVILPLDDLLAQVKRRYKVILTGTGGDELFSGYVRYQLALGDCFQDSYRALFARMKALQSVSERFEMCHFKGNLSLYGFYEPAAQESFLRAFSECQNGFDPLGTMLNFDRRYFLPGLLNIDDKMCGRHSLESRPSLLHQTLLRHLNKLDPKMLMANGEIKTLLRQLATGILPKPVIHRTDKMGFTTPIGEFVNRSAHLIREQLDGSRFRHFYDLRKMNLTAETKFSREVFGLLILDLWLNRYARCPDGVVAA